MKIVVFLSRKKVNNLHDIYVQFRNGEMRKQVNAGCEIKESDFDKKKGLVKSSNLNASFINTRIILLKNEFEKKYYTGNQNEIFKRKEAATSFAEYASIVDRAKENRMKKGSIKKNLASFNIINNYAPKLLLTEITEEWCSKFENYLRKYRNNGDGGVWKNLKYLYTITNHAHDSGVMDFRISRLYKLPKLQSNHEKFLTYEEMISIKEFLEKNNLHISLTKIGYMFLFSFATGMRFQDIANFDSDKNIVDNRIIVKTLKTGSVVSFEITPFVKFFLEKLKEHQIIRCYNYGRKCFVELCKAMDLKKTITFHYARHSFATHNLNLGTRLEVISRLMGHSNISTTSIYAKVVNKLSDEAMSKWGWQ